MRTSSQMKVQQYRILHIDFLRALGIVLMIMGHVGFGKEFDHYIHAFHMPMFFIITGYFYRDRTVKELARSRFFSLILPYIGFGLFHIVLSYILNGQFDLASLRILVFDNTSGSGIPISGALWFLTALLLGELIFCAIQNLHVENRIRVFLIIVVSVLGMCLAEFLPMKLPWGLDAAMTSVGLIYFGKLLRNSFGKLLKLPFWLSALLFMGFSVLIMVNGHINMRHGTYGLWPLFWLNALGMTIVLWNLCRLAEDLLIRLGLINLWPVRCIVNIGRHSILYLCLNQLAILVTNAIIGAIIQIPSGRSIYFLAIQILVTILVLIELKLIEVLYYKAKDRIIRI